MTFSFETVPADCDRVIRQHSRSFSWASRLLPPVWQQRSCLLYAWCRWCDDAVDCEASTTSASYRLNCLRDDVRRIYWNQPPRHAASFWLANVVRDCAIPQQLPLDLLRGMEMDVQFHPPETEEDLLKYCYHAAGCVGLMMAYVLETTHTHALCSAKALGMAMQLTNIARDVLEDWQRGRCYIPRQWLSNEDGSTMPAEIEVKIAVERLLDLADAYYRVGRAGISWLPERAQPSILLAADLYQNIGTEIRRRGYHVLAGRIRLPTWRIALLATPPLFRALRIALKDKLLVHCQHLSTPAQPKSQKGAAVLQYVAGFEGGLAALGSIIVGLGGGPLNVVKPQRYGLGHRHALPPATPILHLDKALVALSGNSNELNQQLKGKQMTTLPRYLACWGLALTLVMATVLFILVGVNPKDAVYGRLPWLYAALTAASAAVFGYLASRLEAEAGQSGEETACQCGAAWETVPSSVL